MHSTCPVLLSGEEGLRAFIRKSLSCLRVLFSRRSLRSSSRSSVVNPSGLPSLMAAWLTQLRSELSETPISLAVFCGIDLSEERTNPGRLPP
jgi:hypothetical protein